MKIIKNNIKIKLLVMEIILLNICENQLHETVLFSSPQPTVNSSFFDKSLHPIIASDNCICSS